MKTLSEGKHWHLFAARSPWVMAEYCAQWDYHSYIVSMTLFTFMVGFEWVWIKPEKGSVCRHWLRLP